MWWDSFSSDWNEIGTRELVIDEFHNPFGLADTAPGRDLLATTSMQFWMDEIVLGREDSWEPDDPPPPPTGGGTTTGGTGGTTGGSTTTGGTGNGGAPPPPPPATPTSTWDIPTGPAWDETMANLELFFAEMEAALSGPSQNPGADQNSYYPQDYDTVASPTFLNEMGFMTHEDFQAMWDSWSQWPYDYNGVDPEFSEFIAQSMSSTGFSAGFSGGFASVLSLATNHATFIMNGQIVQGTYHPPAEPPADLGDAIFVTTGYWTFTPVGYANNFTHNVQYYGGDPAVSAAEAADILDRQTIDDDALGTLDAKETNAIAKLNAVIAQVTIMLAKLDPNAKLVAADGKFIMVSELQQLWARADFQLDPAGTWLNNHYGNYGVGQALRNGGDPKFIIDVGELWKYMNGKPELALHYVLHELIHVTQVGDQVRTSGGTQTGVANPVESWTSRMAQALATAGGSPYGANWTPPGYPAGSWGPVGPAAYQAPGTPTGSGTGGTGTGGTTGGSTGGTGTGGSTGGTGTGGTGGTGTGGTGETGTGETGGTGGTGGTRWNDGTEIP